MENTNTSREQGQNTGTRDVTYDLTAVLYHALQGVENCRIYMGDAKGKDEHRQFFEQAMQAQRQLAEQAKTLLHDCLMQEVQGGSQGDRSTSAFGQQGMSAGGGSTSGGMAGEIASTQTPQLQTKRATTGALSASPAARPKAARTSSRAPATPFGRTSVATSGRTA